MTMAANACKVVGPTLKVGARGAEVRKLQVLLNASVKLRRLLKPDGAFGEATANAVKDFQRKNKLTLTGTVGADEWTILMSHPMAALLVQNYRVGPQESLAAIAAEYVGAKESPGNRMGDDPRMKAIFEADRYAPDGATDGYAWCCAFVSLCIQNLLARSGMYPTVRPPRESGVYSFRTKWAPAQGCLTFSPTDTSFRPHKGDIVVFVFSHIGIVEKVNGGSVETIEGNTNEAGSREGTICMRKTRANAIVRCFIRLPVTVAYDERAQQCLLPSEERSITIPDFLSQLGR